jgi:hypothetical protein
MSALRRVNYFQGRLLGVDDFQAEQEYHREKMRRHNRWLHGSGVVNGLGVSLQGTAARPTITVKPGVGIDPLGNELELEVESTLPVQVSARALVVVLRYRECSVEPVPVPGPCDDSNAPQYSRIEESSELVIVADDSSTSCGAADLVLARFVRSRAGWRRHKTFRRKRVRRHLA